jgi:uncharacterized protein (UPF0248 family)
MQPQKPPRDIASDKLIITYRMPNPANIYNDVVERVQVTIGEECGDDGLASANFAVMDISDSGGLWVKEDTFIPYHMILHILYQPGNKVSPQEPSKKQVEVNQRPHFRRYGKRPQNQQKPANNVPVESKREDPVQPKNAAS